jgi:hypothetical protein
MVLLYFLFLYNINTVIPVDLYFAGFPPFCSFSISSKVCFKSSKNFKLYDNNLSDFDNNFSDSDNNFSDSDNNFSDSDSNNNFSDSDNSSDSDNNLSDSNNLSDFNNNSSDSNNFLSILDLFELNESNIEFKFTISAFFILSLLPLYINSLLSKVRSKVSFFKDFLKKIL